MVRVRVAIFIVAASRVEFGVSVDDGVEVAVGVGGVVVDRGRHLVLLEDLAAYRGLDAAGGDVAAASPSRHQLEPHAAHLQHLGHPSPRQRCTKQLWFCILRYFKRGHWLIKSRY